jgi:hypothetical protein
VIFLARDHEAGGLLAKEQTFYTRRRSMVHPSQEPLLPKSREGLGLWLRLSSACHSTRVGSVLHSSEDMQWYVVWHARKHENPTTRRERRQTRTFEPPVVENIGLGLFELVISELDQDGSQ